VIFQRNRFFVHFRCPKNYFSQHFNFAVDTKIVLPFILLMETFYFVVNQLFFVVTNLFCCELVSVRDNIETFNYT